LKIIYYINGAEATRENVQLQYNGILNVVTSKGTKYITANGSLGINVDYAQPTNIKFGLDIKGGVRGILQPNTTDNNTIEQIINTLQTRINIYGLREASFRATSDPISNAKFIEISIAGGTKDELKNLIESQGNFEAKVPFVVPVSNSKATLTLASAHEILATGGSIKVEGKQVNPGDMFTLDNIGFVYNGYQNGKINLTATVISGNDVITVFFDPQRSRIENTGSGYRWSFGVQLSSSGSQKFAYVTSNINQQASGYLEAPIVFYLDGRFIDSLNIASTLKGKVETEISITGGAQSMQEALKIKTQLQSILKSGSLPTAVHMIQLDEISPTLGEGFIKNALAAGLAAILGVVAVVAIRYRKIKLILPMLLISLSEVLIVLGVSVVIGWTIDLAAIAGIIASVGTGVNSQIIILDRSLRKEQERIETLSEKLKNAFFVIFGSAGTLIAAMIPLLILGFGLLRGFAIVTIIGVLVGVFIARPAYAVIIRHLMKE
jgi:preprotein translocase subunit SecD